MKKIQQIVDFISKARSVGKYVSAFLDILEFAQLRLKDVQDDKGELIYKLVKKEDAS